MGERNLGGASGLCASRLSRTAEVTRQAPDIPGSVFPFARWKVGQSAGGRKTGHVLHFPLLIDDSGPDGGQLEEG